MNDYIRKANYEGRRKNFEGRRRDCEALGKDYEGTGKKYEALAGRKISTASALRLSLLAIMCLCVVVQARAQDSLDVKMKVSASPALIHVEGRRASGSARWSFRNFYGSAGGLAERVENFALFEDDGSAVGVTKLSPGEFNAAKAVSRFSYDLKLDPPAFYTDEAHVSWLTDERGLLMLADILPLPLKSAKVELTLPVGWNVSTIESRGVDGSFEATDAEHAVFAVGRDVRERRGHAGSMTFTFATTGVWAFDDAEVIDSVEDILKIYEGVTGGVPTQRSLVVLYPLPSSVAGNVWNAETRGSTVVVMSGRLPSKLAAKAQLEGSLTHELFHLWIPNGLALEGEYDWFYEGFTNYEAMRVAMRRGQLTFQDYLNTLGREYDSYRSARGAKEVSLPEASQRRWSGGTPLVYHKGMLVAFLYDLTLLRATEGKSSLGDVYRELFRRFGEASQRADGSVQRADANSSVIKILGDMPGMSEFVRRYIGSAADIELGAAIEGFGLVIEPGGARTHVGVSDSLQPRQRELLRKLGYNEKSDADARKLHERLKRQMPR